MRSIEHDSEQDRKRRKAPPRDKAVKEAPEQKGPKKPTRRRVKRKTGEPEEPWVRIDNEELWTHLN